MMISAQWALLCGIAFSLFFSQYSQLKQRGKAWSTRLLQFSIILLGSALNFTSVLNQGRSGVLVTFFSIVFVFVVGHFGVKIFKVEQRLGLLITMGTAICGGSAIGALAPVIGAESMAITISMAIVFLLNAVAVFVFPPLAHFFDLGQEQFGVLAALAIHDTSSVVAASSLMGNKALESATTLKLTRALWIIPITVVMSVLWNKKERKFTFPWFILGFLGTSLAFTFIRQLDVLRPLLLNISKNGFALTLFLIGLGFDLGKMKEIGLRPLSFALLLWVLVTILSFIYVKHFL
jgi:uncharacterized integral membrane protein (TIGR00698 family)